MKILKTGGSSIQKCADCLSGGGLIIYPTDTVYGLGADAMNSKAVERAFEAKGKDISRPFSIAVGDLEQAFAIAEFNETAHLLVRRFLPGPLTLVLKAKADIQHVTYNGTIAIRVPYEGFTLNLLERFGKPIIATSANISGEKESYSFAGLSKEILDKVDIAVDAGETKYKKASTMVQVQEDGIKILREGAVSSDEIYDAIKK